MPFIPAADTAKVAITMLQRGQRVVNVFHFTKAGGYTTETEVNTLAGNFATAWVANIAPLQASTVTGLNVTATDVSTSGGAGAEIAIVYGGGGGSGDLPTNCTVSVKWNTGFSGRSFRGRTYFVGMVVGAVVGDDISGAYGTSLTTAFDNLLSDMAGFGDTMVVVSYFHLGVPRTSAVVTPITNSSLADLHIDSQRRRLAGRGT